MPFESLGEYVGALERAGELVRVKAKVSSDLEIAEIMRRMMYKGEQPAVLFENVEGSDMQVLGNAFGQQALAVDTHVFRVSQRLGLARAEDPDEVHDQLVAVLPATQLTEATHRLIIHGRRTCTARAPACPVCPVRALCPWPHKTGAPARRPARARRRI